MHEEATGLAALFASLSTPVKAALLTMVITLLRFAYDDDRRKWRRKALETAICITVSWGTSSGLGAVGINGEAAYLVAVAFGWLGADFVRDRARHWLTKKSEE